MTEIPDDVAQTARAHFQAERERLQLRFFSSAAEEMFITGIAHAILMERERCANLVDIYCGSTRSTAVRMIREGDVA